MAYRQIGTPFPLAGTYFNIRRYSNRVENVEPGQYFAAANVCMQPAV
jgi:hypothetical protein